MVPNRPRPPEAGTDRHTQSDGRDRFGTDREGFNHFMPDVSVSVMMWDARANECEQWLEGLDARRGVVSDIENRQVVDRHDSCSLPPGRK